ncbi:MAG: phosphopantetheine-binding protein [Syntrophobacterales bacterium]|jgi:acyl carrier protein
MKDKIKNMLGIVKEDAELPDKISDHANIINDVGLDSLQLLNFLLLVEETLQVEINFEKLEARYLSSIINFCDFISTECSTDDW